MRLYDSTNWQAIPAAAPAVAGYMDGPVSKWPAEGWTRWPNALRITVLGDPKADVLDAELGNDMDAVGWVQWRPPVGPYGKMPPIVYCNFDAWPSLRKTFADAQMPEPLWWIAGGPSFPAGVWAWQYAWDIPGANGGIVDLSTTVDPWPVIVAPAPIPQPGEDMALTTISTTVQMRNGIGWVTDPAFEASPDRVVNAYCVAPTDANWSTWQGVPRYIGINEQGQVCFVGPDGDFGVRVKIAS